MTTAICRPAHLCPKTPTVGRFFAVCLLLALPGLASAQNGRWSADDAVRRALARPELRTILQGELRAARADVAMATVSPNPSLSLTHEQVLGDQRISYLETTITAQQQLDLSGRRRRLRATLAPRTAALKAQMQGRRLRVATAVRAAFHGVRHRQERVAVLDAWIVGLKRAVAATAARQARGDVSEYAVRRMRRELQTAHALQASERSRLAEAWAALRRWTPWDTRPALRGALVPPAPGPAPAGATLPGLLRLQHERDALKVEARAWGSPFWRGWTLGGGYRFANAGGTSGHGFMLSLAVPLAFRNIDRPRLARLAGEQDRVGAELDLQRRLAAQAEAAARQRLVETLQALAALGKPGEDSGLTAMAEAAWRSGEAPLTAFLDASRSETDLKLTRIDLQFEARRAAIELDRRRGLGVLK